MGGPDTNTEIRADAAAAAIEGGESRVESGHVDNEVVARHPSASPWTWSVLRWECGRVAGFPVSVLDKYQKEFLGILQFL